MSGLIGFAIVIGIIAGIGKGIEILVRLRFKKEVALVSNSCGARSNPQPIAETSREARCNSWFLLS